MVNTNIFSCVHAFYSCALLYRQGDGRTDVPAVVDAVPA